MVVTCRKIIKRMGIVFKSLLKGIPVSNIEFLHLMGVNAS